MRALSSSGKISRPGARARGSQPKLICQKTFETHFNHEVLTTVKRVVRTHLKDLNIKIKIFSSTVAQALRARIFVR